MARSSRKDAEKHRTEVIEAAARLFRERGIEGVSVAELMAAAGLTHGGFYKQFGSKEELAELASRAAFADTVAYMDAILGKTPNVRAARKTIVANYLSSAHRDNPGTGCPTAALAHDAASDVFGPAYAEGVEAMAGRLRAAGDPRPLATIAQLAGALLIARATRGTALSDQILDQARSALEAVEK